MKEFRFCGYSLQPAVKSSSDWLLLLDLLIFDRFVSETSLIVSKTRKEKENLFEITLYNRIGTAIRSNKQKNKVDEQLYN